MKGGGGGHVAGYTVPSDDATIDQRRELWRLCTKNSSAATNTFMEACGVVCGILAYSVSHISNHHVVHTHEGGRDSTASVPCGRAHAIKRFCADTQTIFKKDIFLKKILI
jgi:hypothetical protein